METSPDTSHSEYAIIECMRKYTKEQFLKAADGARSISDIIERLGMSKSGSAYGVIKNAAVEYGVNLSLLPGQGYLKGKTGPSHTGYIASTAYTCENGLAITSYKLKLKLWHEKILPKQCSVPDCGITDWFGSDKVLQLDHINGNKRDNRLVNLRILCANCHILTETWGNKAPIEYG